MRYSLTVFSTDICYFYVAIVCNASAALTFKFFCFFIKSLDEIIDKALLSRDGSSTCEDFVTSVQNWLNKIQVVNWLQHNLP